MQMNQPWARYKPVSSLDTAPGSEATGTKELERELAEKILCAHYSVPCLALPWAQGHSYSYIPNCPVFAQDFVPNYFLQEFHLGECSPTIMANIYWTSRCCSRLFPIQEVGRGGNSYLMSLVIWSTAWQPLTGPHCPSALWLLWLPLCWVPLGAAGLEPCCSRPPPSRDLLSPGAPTAELVGSKWQFSL